MGSKSVRVDEEVYDLIESRKRDDETFSEAIERLLSPPPLTDLAGILSDEEAEEFREAIARSRKAETEGRNEIVDRFRDMDDSG